MLQTLAALATRRRLAAMAVVMPPLATGYVRSAAVPAGGVAATWLLLTLVASALGAAMLASYVPVSGWRPDLGCSPCAAVAGLSLVGSVLAIGSYGPSLVGPGLAVAVTLYALTQRLGPAACPTPPTR